MLILFEVARSLIGVLQVVAEGQHSLGAIAQREVILFVVPHIHQFLDGTVGSDAVVGHHQTCDILRACHRCSLTAEWHLDSHRLRLPILDKLHLEVVIGLIGYSDSQRLIGRGLIGLAAIDLFRQDVMQAVLHEAIEFHVAI